MFEARWPMKAFPSSTCLAGVGEKVSGSDVALNSLPRTCLRTVPTNGKYFFRDNDYVRQVDHISGY